MVFNPSFSYAFSQRTLLHEMTPTEKQTEQTLQNHLQAFGQGDVDAVMADYAEDAVFYTPDGPLRGKAEIRPFFEELITDFPPGSTIEISQQTIDDELVYLVWSGESEALTISFATDTLIVRNGKIVQQTFAAKIQSKSVSN